LARESIRSRSTKFAAAQSAKPKATYAAGRARLSVFAVAFGPDLVGDPLIHL
jgi:hypothetical protein